MIFLVDLPYRRYYDESEKEDESITKNKGKTISNYFSVFFMQIFKLKNFKINMVDFKIKVSWCVFSHRKLR